LPDTHALAQHSVPAVLLLSGSGPQNRDGSRADLPGYMPQRDIADSLVGRGFGVLRLDDRGIGASTGNFLGSTTYDFARDAELAAQWLRAQPVVDGTQLTIVGHSEGALVALLVAASDSNVRALVLLGAASQTGREVARWQRRALVAGDPATWPARDRDAVLAVADSNAERAARADLWLSTWFDIDPRTIARRLRLPVLLLHGENDQQVPRVQADELAVALRAGGATTVSVQTFPSTNHLLLADESGDPRGYAQLASRAVRRDVLHAIGEWTSRWGRR
jgi:dipeptidyl aminopeptidase/acylaminoacyl peptidase